MKGLNQTMQAGMKFTLYCIYLKYINYALCQEGALCIADLLLLVNSHWNRLTILMLLACIRVVLIKQLPQLQRAKTAVCSYTALTKYLDSNTVFVCVGPVLQDNEYEKKLRG